MVEQKVILLIVFFVLIFALWYVINNEMEHLTVDEITQLNNTAISNASGTITKDNMQISNLNVANTISVGGLTTMNGGLAVPTGKPVTFGGDVTISGKLNGGSVSQQLPTDPTFNSVTTNGMSNLNGGVSVSNKSFFNDDVNIKGKLIVGGVIIPSTSSVTAGSSGSTLPSYETVTFPVTFSSTLWAAPVTANATITKFGNTVHMYLPSIIAKGTTNGKTAIFTAANQIPSRFCPIVSIPFSCIGAGDVACMGYNDHKICELYVDSNGSMNFQDLVIQNSCNIAGGTYLSGTFGMNQGQNCGVWGCSYSWITNN